MCLKIDILKEAEEIIDNYIKKQSEFSYKFSLKEKKFPIVLYILIAAICGFASIIYFLLK